MKNKTKKELLVFYMNKQMGKIFFSSDGSFDSDVPAFVLDIIKKTRNKIKEEGITDLGEVITRKPIKLSDKHILPVLWLELEKLGIKFKLPK